MDSAIDKLATLGFKKCSTNLPYDYERYYRDNTETNRTDYITISAEITTVKGLAIKDLKYDDLASQLEFKVTSIENFRKNALEKQYLDYRLDEIKEILDYDLKCRISALKLYRDRIYSINDISAVYEYLEQQNKLFRFVSKYAPSDYIVGKISAEILGSFCKEEEEQTWEL